jgi:hypothetical protein
MTEEQFSKYLTERYEDQINWYGFKSARNKRIYYFLQWLVIILSSTLPFLVIALPEQHKMIPAIVSLVLAIITAAAQTFRFQENWIRYRTMAETLRRERYLFEADLGEYAGSTNKRSMFVNKVESLISSENSLWITLQKQKEEETKSSAAHP